MAVCCHDEVPRRGSSWLTSLDNSGCGKWLIQQAIEHGGLASPISSQSSETKGELH
jgi:6-phosphogluconate dehydrogenase (decarboxylating)